MACFPDTIFLYPCGTPYKVVRRKSCDSICLIRTFRVFVPAMPPQGERENIPWAYAPSGARSLSSCDHLRGGAQLQAS
jgi:hypothetical protein